MVRALFLFLLLLFLARAIWKLIEGVLRGAIESPSQGRQKDPAAPSVKMVQDPVCGTFVVPGKAPSLARAGQTLYFCSDACRENYAAR